MKKRTLPSMPRNRGLPLTTTLPLSLYSYVTGLAQIYNCSYSAALARIVEEHFSASASRLDFNPDEFIQNGIKNLKEARKRNES